MYKIRGYADKILAILALGIYVYAVGYAKAETITSLNSGDIDCFHRVFGQINQFKSSSGKLKNLNSNPRTVVCSPHFSFDPESALNKRRARHEIYFEIISGKITCTAYARSKNSSTLYDSETKSKSLGKSMTVSIEWDTGITSPLDLNTYVPCTLPGGGG